MTRFALPIAAFLILIVFLMIGLTNDPKELPSPYLNKPAPEFELPSLTNPEKTISTTSFAGAMALVNIWATWCVGCRQEHPFLMELAETGTIPIYGIDWRDNRSSALKWLQDYGDPYVDSGFDADGRVGIDWGAYGAPETFLIGADGIVLHKHLGPLNAEIWARDFIPLIDAQVSKR